MLSKVLQRTVYVLCMSNALCATAHAALPAQAVPPLPAQAVPLPAQAVPTLPSQTTKPEKLPDPKNDEALSGSQATLSLVAGMTARTELCQRHHPALAAELEKRYTQWKLRNASLYANATKNPAYAKTLASARLAYAQNNVVPSEAECQMQLNRLGPAF